MQFRAVVGANAGRVTSDDFVLGGGDVRMGATKGLLWTPAV